LLMMDECVGHMIERVVIPKAEEINIIDRQYYSGDKKDFELFKPNEHLVPPMVKAGDGYRVHVTGLTHDERGYPDMSVQAQDRLVKRLAGKLQKNSDAIVDYKEENIHDADWVVVTYGITSRVAVPAIEQARKEGMKVGHLRLITAWPFPEKRISELAASVKAFVVPELNLGQMVREVERLVKGNVAVKSVPHAGGTVHDPNEIYSVIKSCLKG
jgi:2-oxoglutarate/2-oxoacid ferredoxin oxidoreductase subunit alpha